MKLRHASLYVVVVCIAVLSSNIAWAQITFPPIPPGNFIPITDCTTITQPGSTPPDWMLSTPGDTPKPSLLPPSLLLLRNASLLLLGSGLVGIGAMLLCWISDCRETRRANRARMALSQVPARKAPYRRKDAFSLLVKPYASSPEETPLDPHRQKPSSTPLAALTEQHEKNLAYWR